MEEKKTTDQTLIEIVNKRRSKGPVVGIGDQLLVKITLDKTTGHYRGHIVRKMDKPDNQVLGILAKNANGDWFIEPINKRDNRIAIKSEVDLKENNLVAVDIIKERHFGLKRGIIRATLGYIDSEKAISMIAIMAHSIPYVFPAVVLEEANKAKAADFNNREDWRSLPFLTIDPIDAKDHDDAVYAEPDIRGNNDGGFIIFVAIADVAYYVKSGTALDNEALKRSNSVYFPDRVIPMLPERISNDLCSLRESEDRPALAVKLIIDCKGRKIAHSFHRVMIRSRAKLSYQQVQDAVDGRPDEKTKPLFDEVINPLWSAYERLKLSRNQRQPLDLDLPEKKIILDENGRVKDVLIPERLEAHKLIEEFMIQANVCAAETLRIKRQSLLYRIHDQPSLAKQEALREFLHGINLPLSKSSHLTPAKLNTVLQKVNSSDHQELVNQVVLRAQSQAQYSPDNIGHFGLNLENYAHFTSPIRRYADLIVHRSLIKALKLGSDGLTDKEETNLAEIADRISKNERRALAAERETIDRLIAHYLADRVGAAFDARVAGVTRVGLFVSLNRLGADGFVPVATLKDDYYKFDEAKHALIGVRSKRGFQLGDNVNVRLKEVAPVAGALLFEMLTDPRPLVASSTSFHKTLKTKTHRSGRPKNGRR